MSRILAPFRPTSRRLSLLAVILLILSAAPTRGDSGTLDPRLKGIRVPKGFKISVVAAEPTLLHPVAMAFDDQGNLFVAEWKPADRIIETWETIPLPEGGTTRIRRTRKSTTDVIKRLKDADGDGFFESSDVVLEGCEQPTSILAWKNCLYLTCVGRFEKWSDEDHDGLFETRTILADGFSAHGNRSLSSATLDLDGWIYLTTGDQDNRVVGSDASRLDLLRTGGIVRARLDGSKIALFSMGLRNPRSGVAFDANFHPTLIDGDLEDGSKFQGTRLIQPVEDADYGWRARKGESESAPDFDRVSMNGEKPGTLGPLARTGRGSPSGLVIYNGVAFPESFRNLRIEADPTRRVVRGFKIETRAGVDLLQGETTLVASDDDQFRPCQVVIGADGALYLLDRRGRWTEETPAGSGAASGRIYQLRWEGDASTPAKPLKPNHWKRVFEADANKLVFTLMASPDFAEANRAMLELVDRGRTNLAVLLGYAQNTSAALHARLLGIQGARHFWNDDVENAMMTLLGDPEPEVRRLAAQALAVEPKGTVPRLVPKLIPHLDDANPSVAREVALAVGRHAESRAQQNAAVLLRWIYAHPQANPILQDGVIRAIERLGDAGVEEVALAIRTRRGVEREKAVNLYQSLRSISAAEQLEDLIKIPDLSSHERIALIHHFQDFPAGVPLSTQSLADWAAKHDEIEPAEKIAALEACRLAGNPASVLVLALLEDTDESVRMAATALASLSRPPKALDRLVARLDGKDSSASEKLLILRVMGSLGPKAFAPLEEVLRDSEDPAVRKAALQSLSLADPVKAQPLLERAMASPDPALRSQAVRILAASPRGAEILARAFLDRTLGRSELPPILTALRTFDTPANQKRLAAIEDDATRGSGAINPAEIRAKAAQGADAWAGLGVYFRESTRCSGCHKIGGRGTEFGPTLKPGTPAFSPEKVLDAILNPSRELSSHYETTRLTLNDGRSFVGIVSAKDPKSLTLRETTGKEVKIAAELIAERSTEPGSLMPSTLGLDLTPDDLANLVAFLESPSALTSLAHGPKRIDRALTIGPFALGADRLRIPLDRVDPARPLPGQDGLSLNWSPQDATSWGTMNLRGALGSKPGRAFLAVQIRSDRDQFAALRFGVEGATRVYLNGARLADLPEHDPVELAHAFDRPREGTLAPLPDLVKLSLKAGWNLLIVGVDRTGFGDARAAFEIVSPEPVELAVP